MVICVFEMVNLVRLVFVSSAFVIVGATFAQLVPNIGGETSGINTPIRNASRTYQAFYSASALGNADSVSLTGIRFRLSQFNTGFPATGPSQTLSFSDYTIEIAKASSAFLNDGRYLSGATAFTYAQAAGTNTVVRSGGLSLATASFVMDGGGTGPNSFGPVIGFNSQYMLNAGEDVVLTIRHSGYSPAGELQPFFASGTFANGISDAIASSIGSGATQSEGFSSPMIIEFTTSPVPEPTTMIVFSVVSLTAFLRKQYK